MSGAVVWFTGLPASGKSTLAQAVHARLHGSGSTACVLDGDVFRKLVVPTLGYSEPERAAFYEALAQLAAELARQGLIVLVAATAHRREFRRRARSLAPRFFEVWVATPLEECRQRDPKGLYAADAAAGELPGASVGYEQPENADVRAAGGEERDAVDRILGLLA
jgi:adenylylsulfate kinase